MDYYEEDDDDLTKMKMLLLKKKMKMLSDPRHRRNKFEALPIGIPHFCSSW